MRRGLLLKVLAVAVAIVSAGCIAEPRATAPSTTNTSEPADPIVIALIDTGATPYYPIFRVPSDTRAREAVQTSFTTVNFPLPDSAGSPIARDEATWATLEPFMLYHFEGTRLFGMGFDAERRFDQVRDANLHGAGTSYLTAREAPDAVIVMLQVDPAACAEGPECLSIPTVADAMAWAADQPWIDVISVSLSVPANTPDHGAVHPDVTRYLAASERASRSGKILVNAAGNDPAPSITNFFNGPPWVIAVGGAEPATRGEQARASKTVDVVANYTDFAPRFGEGEMEWRSGTSFGAPIVAGTLAHALALVRQTDPTLVVTPQKVRDALNASATYFAPTDWNPTPPGREPIVDDITHSLSTPILTQAQMGWGYVEAGLAPEVARRILENDLGVPPGKEQAAIFQPRWQQAREDYWSAYGS